MLLTILTALGTLAACTAARWYLDRSSRRETEYAHGRVRLLTLWNGGGGFGLTLPMKTLIGASFAALLATLAQFRRNRLGAGLLLGGGVSNLLERLRTGRVYDYVQFPRAPGKIKQFVFNLADFAILLGGGLMMYARRRHRK